MVWLSYIMVEKVVERSLWEFNYVYLNKSEFYFVNMLLASSFNFFSYSVSV